MRSTDPRARLESNEGKSMNLQDDSADRGEKSTTFLRFDADNDSFIQCHNGEKDNSSFDMNCSFMIEI